MMGADGGRFRSRYADVEGPVELARLWLRDAKYTARSVIDFLLFLKLSLWLP